MNPHLLRRLATVAALVGAMFLTAAPAAAVSTGGPDEVLTPLAVRVHSAPDPVRGADNRWHLAYELVIVNQSRSIVGFASIEALDASRGEAVLAQICDDPLAAVFSRPSGETGVELGPGESATSSWTSRSRGTPCCRAGSSTASRSPC